MANSQTLDAGTRKAMMVAMHLADLEGLSDEELLATSLQTPSAFELLMLRYQREFITRAQAVVKSRDEAEDVAQDTFIRIYRFAPKFNRASGTFKSWSLTILMNVARTRYQKKAKERGTFAQIEDEHYMSLADPHDEHKDYIDADEVQRALGKVDKETARLLTMAYIDDLPYQEIANREGTTVGAIKARVHRAKAAVRDALGQVTK